MPIQNATKKSAHDALRLRGSSVFPGGAAGFRLPPCKVTVLSCHRKERGGLRSPLPVNRRQQEDGQREVPPLSLLAILPSNFPALRNQFERRGHGPDGFSQLPDTVFGKPRLRTAAGGQLEVGEVRGSAWDRSS